MAQSDRASSRAQKRSALAEALADLALSEGLDALSLRPAAARLGTSDRMLIYYFGSKAALVAETLGIVSSRLGARLTAVPATLGLSPRQMIGIATGLLAEPDMRPFMALWGDVTARAMRGEAPYGVVARRISQGWTAWVEERTRFPPGIDSVRGARTMLALVEAMSNRRLLGEDDADPEAGVSLLHALLTMEPAVIDRAGPRVRPV